MELSGKDLTISDVVRVSRFKETVGLSEKAKKKIEAARSVVENAAKSDKATYGINTGFGALATIKVGSEDLLDLQRNLLLSHACGVGKATPEEVVRAMMLLRANSLSCGFSGVRIALVEKLIEFLNKNVIPYIPEKGSVGCSGDLAQLAHMSLPLIGEGYVLEKGIRVPAPEVLKKMKIEPLTLVEKEGLSLINGTQAMTARLCLAVNDALNALWFATHVAALTTDVLLGSPDAFDEGIQKARPHPGQVLVSSWLREDLRGSEIRESHRNCPKVQDAYSLRCIPQVHGAALDTINYAVSVIEREINSATDNPLVVEDRIISGGNFHGEPVALIADFLAIAVTDVGNMVERRIDRLLNPKTNENLPDFLASGKRGINSGYMIWQYTAAALCNENKVLSHPASTDSIPTSAYQEDHVSMGMNSCLKLDKVIDNFLTLVSIELMTACRALEFRRPLRSSVRNEELYQQVKPFMKRTNQDDFLMNQFEAIRNLVFNKVRNPFDEVFER